MHVMLMLVQHCNVYTDVVHVMVCLYSIVMFILV